MNGVKKIVIAVAIASAFVSSAASANSSLLYRNDYTLGTDYLGQAISSSSFSVVQTSGDLSSFNLNDYKVVVYANQSSGIPSGDLEKLSAYVSAGGSVIFNDWTSSGAFGASPTGNSNLTTLNLGSKFSTGVSTPLSVLNTSWGIYSYGLSGGTVAATFENGDAAIVVGNGGRSIYNGFLSDSVASTKLYSNELASLAPVPEPETYAMLLAGLGLMAGVARRKQK